MARKLIKQAEKEKRHNMIYNIPKEIAGNFAEDCLSLSPLVKIDVLDCQKSCRRRPSGLSLEEAKDLIDKGLNTFYSFVLRNGYHSQFGGNDARYWEFCASGQEKTENLDYIEHFVWIEISEEDGNKLVEKYKLKKNDENY